MNKHLKPGRGNWLAWLVLARISALPSAISNVLMGFLLAHGNWQPFSDIVLLILSSACLYSGGMILNDVNDREIDGVERPQRPIPAGKISCFQAKIAAFSLLAMGVVWAGVVGWRNEGIEPFHYDWRPMAIASILVGCIWLYDGWLKQTIIAPVLMGACRTLNVLLGASTWANESMQADPVFIFSSLIWWISISIGLFITGVTLMARKEASLTQRRPPLVAAAGLIAVGLMGIGSVQSFFSQGLGEHVRSIAKFPWLIGLISLPIIRHVGMAIVTPGPRQIQAAVVTCLRTIIILDAALCFFVVPDQPIYALIVVGLLVPSIWLGRWIRST